MTHGYKNVLGEERIQVSLFETGNALLDAVLTDWFFGTSGTSITGAGNIATGFAAGVAVLALVLAANGLSGAEAFGGPTVSTATNLTNAGDIASAEACGSPSLAYPLTTTGIASADAYGSPSIGQSVAPVGIGSGDAYGTPAVSLTVTPTGIASAEVFGGGSVALDIGAVGIAGAEAFGTAAVEEGTATQLSANAIAGAEAFGTATVTRDYILTRVAKNKTTLQPVVGAGVFLFDTATKTLQDQTTTGTDGRWLFHLSDQATNYFVVIFKDNLVGVTSYLLAGT